MERSRNAWILAHHSCTVSIILVANTNPHHLSYYIVSRPLFIEEHGLRLLLDREGVGVELSRQSYEAGDWAGAVEEAWAKGRESKWQKREIGVGERSQEHGRQMARMIVDWVREWQET
jgi:hypothetical protein